MTGAEMKIPTPDELEAMLARGELKRIGDGSRRECYAIPGTQLCLKCYRDESTAPNATVAREIRKYRHDEKRNTCAQEYRYWLKIQKGEEDLRRIFPATLQLVHLPSRGWGLVEELILNADGTPARILEENVRFNGFVGDGSLAKVCARLFALRDRLVNAAIRFYDPSNVLIQWHQNGAFSLRIADFEPRTRTFIPFDELTTTTIRRKCSNRFYRFFRNKGIRYPDRISFSFCISDSYAQHLAVVIRSIIANNPCTDFVFHVVHHDLKEATVARLRKMAGKGDSIRFAFHRVDPLIFDCFPLPSALKHVSREMYYRYLLPEILRDERRTIYMDVDVLCQAPVHALWETDLKRCPLGAVEKIEHNTMEFLDFKERLGLRRDEPYFCSGLLVMDLEQLRTINAFKTLMDNTARLSGLLAYPDQDAINVSFRGNIAPVSRVWSSIDRYSVLDRKVRIWHFMGWTQKPWCFIWKNTAWIPYLRHLLATPYSSCAAVFLIRHLTSLVFCSYEKKNTKRWLLFGILIWKRKTT